MATKAPPDSQQAETEASEQQFCRYWRQELAKAKKREKRFRKEGLRIVRIYEDDRAPVDQGAFDEDAQRRVSFNVLYSNTETLAPALYNSQPRPNVTRRFRDDDPVGKEAAHVLQRTLEYLIDSGDAQYPSFDSLMRAAVVDGLVPGRGITRYKYDAEIEVVEPDGEVVEGMPPMEPEEQVSYEMACGKEVAWDDFLHGYAKRWEDVPWCAVRHLMSREELVDNFGPEIGSRVKLTATSGDEEDPQMERDGDSDGAKLAEVWEIWNKIKREVFFISPGLEGQTLKRLPDPLELQGFYPWPQPLTFTTKISSLVPVALYQFYEVQARELNVITNRLIMLTKACKVRGFYNSIIQDVEKVLQADDNDLLPAQGLGLDANLGNMIWLVPIDTIIGVIQQLMIQREQTKQVIYEITGIADIMRGSSDANETLGAQQLKNQWGSLRLRKLQREVIRYVRDSLRILAEIAAQKFSIETLKGMTGIQLPTMEQQQQAQMFLQQIQMVAEQAEMAGQQPPPELMQQAEQAQKVLSTPSWEAVTEVLRNDLQRNYKIDIETNSTIDAAVAEEKQDVAEFMNALAQFMNGIGPGVASGVIPFAAAKAIMLGVVRRFRFGVEVEDELKEMQPPQPPPDPKAEEAQIEAQRGQIELQKAQIELQAKQIDLQQKQQEAQATAALKAEEHAFRLQELQRKAELATMQHRFKMRELQAKAAVDVVDSAVRGIG